MVEQPTERRELRWRFAFFVVATLYILLLLVGHLATVFGGFGQIIITVFLAWLLAFVLAPVVGWVRERTEWPRGVAVGLVYAVALLLSGGLLFFAGSTIGAQLGQLAEDFPQTRQDIEATLVGWQQAVGLDRSQLDSVEVFRDAEEQVGRIGSGLLGAIPGVGLAVIGGLVLVLILSLYMVLDSERIVGWLKRLVPDRFDDEAELLERSVARAFSGFLRTQIILAAVQAMLTVGIGLAVGLPYLFLVAFISTVAMLIPFFGPPLALLPPIIAIAIYAPEWFLIAAPLLVVAQTILVNYLQPRLMQGALGMHPLVVLVGLLVGAQVAGVWGALFGIPVIAVLSVFVGYVVNIATLHDTAEVEVDVMIEEARRQAPDASKEELVALAAGMAEEAHEEAQEAPEAEPLRMGRELRATTQELHATSVETKEAAHELRGAAHDVRDAATHILDAAGGRGEPPAGSPEVKSDAKEEG